MVTFGIMLLSGCANYQANKLYEMAQSAESSYDWKGAKNYYTLLLDKYADTKIAVQAKTRKDICAKKQEEIDSLIAAIENSQEKKQYETCMKNLEKLFALEIDQKTKTQYQEVLDNVKLQLAETYYNKKRYKKAFSLFKDLAEKGNAYAQYCIGFMLQYGQGTIKNSQSAEVWYKKAAEQGQESAINELKGIEKLKALDRKTADRKSYRLYNFLGKDISDVLRSVGGNYDAYRQESHQGIDFSCYFWGGYHDQLYVCHKDGSTKVTGVGYRYPINIINLSNLPKLGYNLPKSFLNLDYEEESSPAEKRIYSIKNEEWTFYLKKDMNWDTRVYATSIFIL